MSIFAGIQWRQKKTTADTVIKPPNVTLIQSASTLLASEKRQEHLKKIKALLNLPPKLYQDLYHEVIEQFAEFVQSLPENAQGIFSYEYSFLDHGLERAARALSLCLGYFFPKEMNFQSISSQQALWVYAVFTAALLYDVGKLAVKYQIEICQKNGTPLQPWSPYSCSMVAQGKYYKYEFLKENRDNLRRLVTPLLARQILVAAQKSDEYTANTGSLSGFNWLASDPDVLEAWLMLLNGNTRTVNAFLTVIPLADMQVIESHAHHIRNTGIQPAGMFGGIPLGGEEYAGFNEINAAFLQWLRTGLENHSISVNQDNSHVHTTVEGVVIFDSIFNQYLSETSDVKQSPSEIARQFRTFLDLYQMSFSEQMIQQRHISGKLITLAPNQALVIRNEYLLFPNGQLPTNYSSLVQIKVLPHTQQPPIPSLLNPQNIAQPE